jgi:hypothetical protein
MNGRSDRSLKLTFVLMVSRSLRLMAYISRSSGSLERRSLPISDSLDLSLYFHAPNEEKLCT